MSDSNDSFSPSTQNEGSVPSIDLPSVGASIGWLFGFFALYFLGLFIYIIGYSVSIGIEYGMQGIGAPDPAELEAQVQAHIFTASGITGMYLTQCLVLLPAIWLAARFPRQSWHQTLGFHRFSARSLLTWVMVFAVYFVCTYFIGNLLEIDPGEIMRMLSGSHHLGITLVLVIGAPLLEELVFRGYFFKAWRHTRLGLSGTLLLTSLLFTAIHLGQYNLAVLSMIFVLSMILGLAREKTGSIWVPMILHALNNGIAAITVIYFGIL